MKRDTKIKRNTRMDLLSKSLVSAVKNDSIFGEIMLGINFFKRDLRENKKKSVKIMNSSDKYVKVCPKCKLCWEKIRLSSKQKGKNTMYYKDFSKYGKAVELCDKCKGENDE